MAKKLSITIPNDLYGKLEPFRSKINISSVCSAALEKEVDEIGNYIMTAKVKFCMLSESELENMVYKWGIKWAAEKASIEELAFLCQYNINTFFDEYNNIPKEVKDSVLKLLSSNKKFKTAYYQTGGDDGSTFNLILDMSEEFISEIVDNGLINGIASYKLNKEKGAYDWFYEYEDVETFGEIFIKGARVIWDKISDKALMMIAGKDHSAEIKNTIEKSIEEQAEKNKLSPKHD